MEEVENQTKKDLIIIYLFSSLMIIMTVFVLLVMCIVFSPEGIADEQVRLGSTFGFIALAFIMVIMLGRNMDNLFDVIYKLNEGEYM